MSDPTNPTNPTNGQPIPNETPGPDEQPTLRTNPPAPTPPPTTWNPASQAGYPQAPQGYPQYPQGPQYTPPQYAPPPPGFWQAPAPQKQSLGATLKNLPPWAKAVGGVVAVLIVLCIMCSCCAGLLGRGGDTTTSGTSVVGHPVNRPVPTQVVATPNPNASAGDWENMVAGDTSTLQADAEAAGYACNAGDLQGCRDSMVTFDTDVQQFQADLDAHPAPPCLKAVDGYLRNALHLYDQAAQDAIRGIDTYDSGLIHQATSLMNSGSAALDKATAAKKKAQCS